MEGAFALSVDEVVDRFGVSLTDGLNDAQVAESLERHGKNAIPEDPPTPLWKLVLEQFKDQLVIILLASAAISLFLAILEGGDDLYAFVDPAVILTILILNAIVGVTQESSAEKAIAALNEYSANEAKVVRDGHLIKIKAEDLVPGDLVDVAVGDRIPADCRLVSINSNSFRVDQAILTGEGGSVSKETTPVKDEKAVKQDQVNMLFSGTTVTVGHARAIVVLTGQETAIGDIHSSIVDQISEPTPLKQKLNDFGDQLAKVIMVICILVWVINIRHFTGPSHDGWLKGAIYYLKIAVSLGVAAIPEGLAAVITTCLALGTRKMAKKNALVRSLPSVETLGSCSVICSDKTGTLTTNQMSVSKAVYFSESDGALSELTIQGTTFSPDGNVNTEDGKILDSPAATSRVIRRMAEVSALCNDAEISYDAKSNSFAHVGEPTEAALKVLAEKLGTPDPGYNQQRAKHSVQQRLNETNKYYENQFRRLATYEFARDRKSMSVLVESNGDEKLFVKGAPESILERCTSIIRGRDGKKVAMTPAHAQMVSDKVSSYAKQGLRVIALAFIDGISSHPMLHNATTSQDYLSLEQNMTFVGAVAMLDPPRPEVAESIRKCKEAGIRVVVITGDNKQTAETICRQIGVFDVDEDLTGKSYTGREFDNLTASEQLEAANHACLFSRTEPTHKSRLVDLLQSGGEVVAMTGDGVNDAPALKKSDIGVAMGSGTDVAKLAADMVLADDNFATIELAVEEGRSIYNNTQQFIRYLISSNIGEVVSIFLTVLLGMPEALIPVQLLWVNLVTDGLPATALSFNPPDHDIMRRRPRKRDEPLVTGWLFFRYMVIGTQGPQISFYHLTHFHKCSSAFPEIGCEMFTNDMSKAASTVSLSILVVIEMFNAMNALSSSESLVTLPLWNNLNLIAAIALSMALHFMILYVPFLQAMFSITPLDVYEWSAVVAISLPVIFIDEILKFVERQVYNERTVVKAKKE
ncbi:hypothetical protein ABW21_db0207994 [Orbilia brochopaga]|nr:hypothetical protein ABW21_db0207994 [Drechslerella brochopaga]